MTKKRVEESVSEGGKGRSLTGHLFVLKMAAGICSEAGFVAVAKRMLLAFVAIARREAGLLTSWGSDARKIAFEGIIFSCVVEGVVRRLRVG